MNYLPATDLAGEVVELTLKLSKVSVAFPPKFYHLSSEQLHLLSYSIDALKYRIEHRLCC